MRDHDIDQWAQKFAADLIIGADRVPFDRVVRRHLDDINRLRGTGLTWASLAAALERAGAVRSGGRPYTPDQLRADFSRLKRRRNLTAHLPRPASLSAERSHTRTDERSPASDD
jgi:hypothetical protein